MFTVNCRRHTSISVKLWGKDCHMHGACGKSSFVRIQRRTANVIAIVTSFETLADRSIIDCHCQCLSPCVQVRSLRVRVATQEQGASSQTTRSQSSHHNDVIYSISAAGRWRYNVKTVVDVAVGHTPAAAAAADLNT